MHPKIRDLSFTLLEVMISILIVTVALLALQTIIIDKLDDADNAIKQRTARTLARQKLEEYLAAGGQGGGQGGFEEPELQGFTYNITQEEQTVGETGKIIKATITIRFPLDNSGNPNAQQNNSGFNSGFSSGFDGESQGQYQLSTYVAPPENQ